VSCIALLVTGLATLVFGLVVMVVGSSDEQYLRSIGAASVGMGLFGAMITATRWSSSCSRSSGCCFRSASSFHGALAAG